MKLGSCLLTHAVGGNVWPEWGGKIIEEPVPAQLSRQYSVNGNGLRRSLEGKMLTKSESI